MKCIQIICVSVHSGLDPRSWGGMEGRRDHQRLQRRRDGASSQTGRWDSMSDTYRYTEKCCQFKNMSRQTVVWRRESFRKPNADVSDVCLISLWSIKWVQKASLFLSYVTRTSWWGKMTSPLSATCMNLRSFIISEFASWSRTTSTPTVVSNSSHCLSYDVKIWKKYDV